MVTRHAPDYTTLLDSNVGKAPDLIALQDDPNFYSFLGEFLGGHESESFGTALHTLNEIQQLSFQGGVQAHSTDRGPQEANGALAASLSAPQQPAALHTHGSTATGLQKDALSAKWASASVLLEQEMGDLLPARRHDQQHASSIQPQQAQAVEYINTSACSAASLQTESQFGSVLHTQGGREGFTTISVGHSLQEQKRQLAPLTITTHNAEPQASLSPFYLTEQSAFPDMGNSGPSTSLTGTSLSLGLCAGADEGNGLLEEVDTPSSCADIRAGWKASMSASAGGSFLSTGLPSNPLPWSNWSSTSPSMQPSYADQHTATAQPAHQSYPGTAVEAGVHSFVNSVVLQAPDQGMGKAAMHSAPHNLGQQEQQQAQGQAWQQGQQQQMAGQQGHAWEHDSASAPPIQVPYSRVVETGMPVATTANACSAPGAAYTMQPGAYAHWSAAAAVAAGPAEVESSRLQQHVSTAYGRTSAEYPQGPWQACAQPPSSIQLLADTNMQRQSLSGKPRLSGDGAACRTTMGDMPGSSSGGSGSGAAVEMSADDEQEQQQRRMPGRKAVGFRVTPKGIRLTRNERQKQSMGALERQVQDKQSELGALANQNRCLQRRIQILELATGRQQVALVLFAAEQQADTTTTSSSSSSRPSQAQPDAATSRPLINGNYIVGPSHLALMGLPAVLGGVNGADLTWARSVTLDGFTEWWSDHMANLAAALAACQDADAHGGPLLGEADAALSALMARHFSRTGLVGMCQATIILRLKGYNMSTRESVPAPDAHWESVVARMSVGPAQIEEMHLLFGVYCQLHKDLSEQLRDAQSELEALICGSASVFKKESFTSCSAEQLSNMTGQVNVLKRVHASMQKTQLLYNSTITIAANCILTPREFAKCCIYSYPYFPCGPSMMKACETLRSGEGGERAAAVAAAAAVLRAVHSAAPGVPTLLNVQ